MTENHNLIATFGRTEVGSHPLQAYIDPTLFDTIDRQSQIERLTSVFYTILTLLRYYNVSWC